jgi:hypothetical protein
VTHLSATEIDRYLGAPRHHQNCASTTTSRHAIRRRTLDTRGDAGARARKLAQAWSLDRGTEHPTEEEIAALVDRTLDDVDREIVAAHLQGCTTCREDVEDLYDVAAGLRAVPSLAAPARRRAWYPLAGLGRRAGRGDRLGGYDRA